MTCDCGQRSLEKEYQQSVEDGEGNDNDKIIFLSADIEGGYDGFKTTEEALDYQQSAQGDVGKWTNSEKDRFALVDEEELLGRRDREMRNIGMGSEKPETLLDPFRKARTKDEERKVIAARFALNFSFFLPRSRSRSWMVPYG